jgi:hypothetical protein
MMAADRRAPRLVFTLTVRDVGRPDDAPVNVRLRRVAKALLRHYGLALVQVRPADRPVSKEEETVQHIQEDRPYRTTHASWPVVAGALPCAPASANSM